MTFMKPKNLTPKATAIAIACGIVLTLASCTTNQRRASITGKFPDAEVLALPNHPDEFLVRKPDGSVWLVFYGNPLSSEPTSESIAFPATERTEVRAPSGR